MTADDYDDEPMTFEEAGERPHVRGAAEPPQYHVMDSVYFTNESGVTEGPYYIGSPVVDGMVRLLHQDKQTPVRQTLISTSQLSKA